MELYESFQKVINEHGRDIVRKKLFVNILDDEKAFEDDKAYKNLLKTFVESPEINRFLDAGEMNMQNETLIRAFADAHDFHEKFDYVVNCLVFALGWTPTPPQLTDNAPEESVDSSSDEDVFTFVKSVQLSSQDQKLMDEHARNGSRLYNEKKYSMAYPLLSEAAKMGHAGSQNLLGVMYTYGYGVNVDYVKALDLFKRSAGSGNPYAIANIGCAYHHGWGVEQDYVKAKSLYDMALRKGFPPHDKWIANLVDECDKFIPSANIKRIWFAGAVDPLTGLIPVHVCFTVQRKKGENVSVHISLSGNGRTLKQQDTIKPNFDDTIWKDYILEFRSSDLALPSFKSSMCKVKFELFDAAGTVLASREEQIKVEQLSFQDSLSKGVECFRKSDFKSAFKLLEPAAATDVNAMYYVGRMFFTGLGTKCDRNKGLDYLKKSANGGNVEAMKFLGNAYQYGQGVGMDYSEAMRWYKKIRNPWEAGVSGNIDVCSSMLSWSSKGALGKVWYSLWTVLVVGLIFFGVFTLFPLIMEGDGFTLKKLLLVPLVIVPVVAMAFIADFCDDKSRLGRLYDNIPSAKYINIISGAIITVCSIAGAWFLVDGSLWYRILLEVVIALCGIGVISFYNLLFTGDGFSYLDPVFEDWGTALKTLAFIAVLSFGSWWVYNHFFDPSNRTYRYVVMEKLNMRSEESASSQVVETLPYGAKVEILDEPEGESSWVHVKDAGNDKEGYVNSGMVRSGGEYNRLQTMWNGNMNIRSQLTDYKYRNALIMIARNNWNSKLCIVAQDNGAGVVRTSLGDGYLGGSLVMVIRSVCGEKVNCKGVIVSFKKTNEPTVVHSEDVADQNVIKSVWYYRGNYYMKYRAL